MTTEYYNWKDNKLTFKEFNLQFKGNKTIISGASGTGKTLLTTLLSKEVTSNIFILTNENKDGIYLQDSKLIIIDRADYILNNNLVQFINQDFKNRYLIFSRKPLGIELSPNHFGEFINNEISNCIEIKYYFNVKDW